jgi:hypothetical protein
MQGKHWDSIHSILPTDPVGPGTYDPYRAEHRAPGAHAAKHISSRHPNAPSAGFPRAPAPPLPAEAPHLQLYAGRAGQRGREGIFSPGPAAYSTAGHLGGAGGAVFGDHNTLVADLPALRAEARTLTAEATAAAPDQAPEAAVAEAQ